MKRVKIKVFRLITLYFTILLVAVLVIKTMTGVSFLAALATASVSCLLKTVAVHFHDYVWSKMYCGPCHHCGFHRHKK